MRANLIGKAFALIGAAGFLFYLSMHLIPWAALAWFEYRLTGWEKVAAAAAWLLALVPLLLVLLGSKGVAQGRAYLTLLIICLPFGAFFVSVIPPLAGIEEGMRHSTWPRDLTLRTFKVCPTRVQRGGLSDRSAEGDIAVEIRNTAAQTVSNARFTVETGWLPLEMGKYGVRVRFDSLAPGESRSVVLHEYLGQIPGPRGATREPARIYFDAGYLADGRKLPMEPRPSEADFNMLGC